MTDTKNNMCWLITGWFVLTVLSCGNQSARETPASVDASEPAAGWKLAEEIERNIIVPDFPAQTYNVLDYGVQQGAGRNDRLQFAKAIAACHEGGGGRVLVPKGVYHTGPIHLLNNVNLHLEEGAEIRFSTRPEDYLPLVHTSFEGNELMNYSPLIYAFEQENIAVTGKGTLNGQAGNDNWWTWKGKEEYGWKEGMPCQNDAPGRPRLVELAAQNTPVKDRVFGTGFYLRPSFIEFYGCRQILIQGVRIVNAPFWILHPMKSEHITVDGVTVESHGPNNDGCDPEYCRNVVIKNCTFNTGDDCIAIKSGRNEDGRRVGIASERIVVRDCRMIDGHGGVVMGSEISAGVRDVFVENCAMDSPNLDRAIRIKTNSKRGGFVENVYVRNLEIGQVKEAVLRINLFYATYSGQEGSFIPRVRNIYLENIKVKNGGKYGILARGYEELPIEEITLKNVVIEKVGEPWSMENVEGLQLTETYINGEYVESPDQPAEEG